MMLPTSEFLTGEHTWLAPSSPRLSYVLPLPVVLDAQLGSVNLWEMND